MQPLSQPPVLAPRLPAAHAQQFACRRAQVMGMSQIMGRLVNIMCTQSQLDTLQSFSREDPITGVPS